MYFMESHESIMEKGIRIFENPIYRTVELPAITVITPFFNRINVLDRALQSVNRQTYRNFEYIVIDDGSTENGDDIVNAFMNSVDFPMLYIKKPNGGVHTARNAGIRYARGRYIAFLDSDDELLPNGLQILFDAWNRIPENSRQDYFEVNACYIDQNGKEVCERLPDNINDLPLKQAVKLFERVQGDHNMMCRSDIMKGNPWPEPAGITFVMEGILWCRLRRKYRSYYINDFVAIVHTESDDSLSRSRKRNMQIIKNRLWNIIYRMNDRKVYFENKNMLAYLKEVSSACVLSHVIRIKGEYVDIKPKGILNWILIGILWVPAFVLGKAYVKKKMNAEE